MDFLKPSETVAALQEFKDGIEIGHLSVSGAFDLCKILYIRWPINYRTKKQKRGKNCNQESFQKSGTKAHGYICMRRR
jgi:hypothetical protein